MKSLNRVSTGGTESEYVQVLLIVKTLQLADTAAETATTGASKASLLD